MLKTAFLAMALPALLCPPTIAADKASSTGQLRITLRLPATVQLAPPAFSGGEQRLCVQGIPPQRYSLALQRAGRQEVERIDPSRDGACIAALAWKSLESVTIVAE